MKAPPFHGLTFQKGVPGAQPSPAQPSRSVTAARPTSNTPAREREAGKPEETFSCLSSVCLLATGSHPETGRPRRRAARVHPDPDRCPPARPQGPLCPRVAGSADGKACPAFLPA